MRFLLSVSAASIAIASISAGAIEPGIDFDRVEDRTIVIATGAPADGQLSLHLVDAEREPSIGPAMLSDQRSMKDGQRQLTPRFGLVAGSVYRAQLHNNGKLLAEADWKEPDATAAVPTVTSIEPGAVVLPANLLKFYLTFSEPMRQSRNVFDLIHLEQESGKRIDAPWRQQELWSDDHRTLTLWIHPGRVKQGVNLRTTMGPVLEPGKNYTLIVEAGLLSLPGIATAQSTHKSFRTSAEDYQRPSAKDWQLTLPHIGTRQALTIESPEPLDTALALRYLSLTDGLGETVEATFVTRNVGTDHGRRFTFLPKLPWRAETYTLHAGEFLEDLAGNTPTRVFDTDLENPIPEASKADLELDFRPLPAIK